MYPKNNTQVIVFIDRSTPNCLNMHSFWGKFTLLIVYRRGERMEEHNAVLELLKTTYYLKGVLFIMLASILQKENLFVCISF